MNQLCNHIHVQLIYIYIYICWTFCKYHFITSFVLVWSQVGRGPVLYTVKYAYLQGSPWHMSSSLKCHGYHWPVIINLIHLNQPLFHDDIMKGSIGIKRIPLIKEIYMSLFPLNSVKMCQRQDISWTLCHFNIIVLMIVHKSWTHTEQDLVR